MMLRELFSTLGFPRGGAEFVAERIAGWPNFRVARDRSGKAAVLISHDAEGGVEVPATIELRHVAFWAAAECEITSSEGATSGTFAIIRWKSEGGVLQDMFLEVLGSWIATLGNEPNVRTIRSGFDRLAQVFATLEGPAARDVIGIWGELLLIACAQDPEELVKAWHVDPHELCDFQAGLYLLEVKTTTAGIRRHDFSLAQLSPPAGARLIVASIMLASDGTTLSILDLAGIVKARLRIPDLRLRVDVTVISTLGGALQAGVTQRFNAALSASTLRFFDGAQVPCVPRTIPVEVSDVRFKAELDGLAPVSDSSLGRISPFHAMFRPAVGPERWMV